MIELILLHFVIIVHVFFWIYVLFGGLISEYHNNAIIVYIIPFTYLIHIFTFHILSETKYVLMSNTKNKKINNDKIVNMKDINNLSSDDKYNICQNGFINNDTITNDINNIINKYTIPKYFEIFKKDFKNCFQNPLSAQGLLILGYIINIYLYKFYYHFTSASSH